MSLVGGPVRQSSKFWIRIRQRNAKWIRNTATGAAANYFILLVNSVGPGEREKGSADENSLRTFFAASGVHREFTPPLSPSPYSPFGGDTLSL